MSQYTVSRCAAAAVCRSSARGSNALRFGAQLLHSVIASSKRATVAPRSSFGLASRHAAAARSFSSLTGASKSSAPVLSRASLQALFGDKLVSAAGEVPTADLKDKIVGLYFSAHWCPPCRTFTPELAKVYSALQASGKPFEIIFVSADQDAEAFDSYFKTHPWKAIPYASESIRSALNEKFAVKGIPSLIVIKPDGSVISREGRNEVNKSKEAAWESWSKL